MSTNTIPLPSSQDKISNEDSMISTSTTISVTESITQDISKIKNAYLIPKNIVQRIPEILSFLQSDSNTATNKIPVMKYLQSLFLNVEFNSEIFLRKSINEKEKLNLYKIIINQYIFYTNNNNLKTDEENYRNDLQNLFVLLLSQVTLNKETYHYILSPLINFINEKNILNLNKKNLEGSNSSLEVEPLVNFKSEHLNRVLVLLKYFYGYHKKEQSSEGITNYLFFSGDNDSSIIIRNKENPLDHNNKKILNFDETLCIMMFIKVLPSEYIKTIHPKIRYRLLELNFLDKKQSIQINMNIDNEIYIPPNEEPIEPKLKLKENETNCILMKFNYNKKKSIINCQIYIGSEKFDLPPILLSETEKEKNSKTKYDIKDIVFFKNFIGTCSNIMIYKEKKNEGLPKILFPNLENKQRLSFKSDNNDNNKSNSFCVFPKGIFNEELYSYFSNAELIEQQDNITQQINIVNKKNNSSKNINYNIFKDFLDNNLISLYIPTRYEIPNQPEEKTIQNASQIILVDSINHLNAEFNTRTPALNGLHIFQNLYENDLTILGGINNLLPIIEIMLDNNELLNSENFSSFFNLISVYVFSAKYQEALSKDESNFFKCLSYLLEKMPEKFFNNELVENFRNILGFLCPPNGNGKENKYAELKNQFFNCILTNEKILLKFNEDNQKNLIGQIYSTVENSDLDADIIKIIRIMLSYDKNRNYKFCCRYHSQYFNENYSIMDPELSTRLQPIEKLLEVVFDKKYKSTMKQYDEMFGNVQKNPKKISSKNLKKIDDLNKFEDNDLYYLFYLLTYDISPCHQKSIIDLINYFLKSNNTYENFLNIFDKKNELFDIILFVFKTSIFDIKIQVLNILLLIDRNNNWEHLQNKEIKIFIENEILPIFLIDEVNTLPNIKEKENEEKNEIKIEEKKGNENENSEEIKNKIEEKNIKEDINNYGIKPEIEIDKIKYILFSETEIEKKTYSKYNKKQFNNLLNSLYTNIIVFLYDVDIIFNLVVKIVSRGDLLLINNFLSKIRGIIESPDSQKNPIYNKITNNDYFLQFILDTYLQLYILNNNKNPNKKFITSFSLDLHKKNPLSEEERKDIFKKTLNDCEKILLYMLTENITNFDYVLTWGKYYEKIKEENDIYNYIFEIIDKILYDIISGQNKAVVTLSSKMNLSEPQIQSTLYFYNISLEYITFFKLKYDNSFFQMDKADKFKILEEDLRYILFNQEFRKIDNLSPIQELELNDDKMNNYAFIMIVMSTLFPLWMGEDKKAIKNEKDLYNKLTINSVNKNIFMNELDFLLYSFDEKKFFKNNEKNLCNKGIKMITLLYIIFICLLNIGGPQGQIMEYLGHFRLFLSVLIISPPSINVSEMVKKKKWANEHQSEEINSSVHSLLFNSIFFLYNKLQNLKNLEKDYNSKTESEKEKEKKTIESILILKKIYMENLGYILKILNKIYRALKEEENQNKSWNIFKSRNKIFEKIRKSGAFSLINELYNECFITMFEKTNTETPKKKNKEYLRSITEVNDLKNTNENNFDLKPFKSEEVLINNSVNLENGNKENQIKEEETPEPKKNVKKLSLNLEIPNEEILLDGKSDKTNNNIDNKEENYLDDITKINFKTEKMNPNNITVSDDDYKNLEKNMNLFLDDEKIKTYYERHYDQNIKNIYAFIPTIQKRQEKLKTIIPVFDNRKNISKYPYDICIVPYYYPENFYKEKLMKKIENMSNNLKEEIKLCTRILDKDKIAKEVEYRNYKKKMFKFRGIWSYEDFFYDTKRYRLKYKLLNHYTNDFTKIFMTPITDIDYYLPKFSRFKGDIFRNELNDGAIIPITKLAEICFAKNKSKNDINNNTETQKKQNNSENINNTSTISFDSSNYSYLSILNDTKENADILINPVFELNQEYYNFLKEQELNEIKNSENLVNNFNPKDFELFTKFIEKTHLKNKGQTVQCDACLVKLSFHIRGIIYINNTEIGFYCYEIKRKDDDEDYDLDKKVCFGSIFLEPSEKYNTYYLKIPLDQIEIIFKRRFYFKKNVLEFFTQNKKSYFFRIDEKKFDEFFNILISNTKKTKDFDDISIESNKSEEKVGLVNKSNLLYDYNNYQSLFFSKRVSTTKNLYIKWTKWEISTFTLLNYINIFASRSYHDINQYPVFPWIITDYTNEEIPDLSLDSNTELTNVSDYIPKIRPFGTPMGMLGLNEGSKERRDNYIMNFESPDEKNPEENYDRYGSHYSTGLNLTYYLVRVFPFSYIRIEMQGKNFDDPNRLFNSLETSFENAITQKSDLRELIPEFFCFPEMFYNINDLNLGEIYDSKLKKNILVNDILMPLWSNNNAYNFVKLHREMLESVEISEKIHEWFNIIFGSKQKGKPAKKIHNLFIEQTYDDFDEKHNKLKEIGDKIYQKRMVEFGVTPSQVFKSDVDKRIQIKNLRKKPIMYEFMAKKVKKCDKKNAEKNNEKSDKNLEHLFSWEEENEIKIRESELYIEGEPYKMFSSWKIDEEHKHEKMLFLYSDKVRIISKSEKGFFKKIKVKSISTKELTKINIFKDNNELKEIIKEEDKEKESNEMNENDIKEEKEKEKEIEMEEKNEIKENNNIKEENIIEDKDNKNSNDISIEDESEIKEEEINEITSNRGISKYDRILMCPKYRMDINQSPAIIYDKGNYIALGGFWNGQIIINKLEEQEKFKKNKNMKNITIIQTNELSPVTNMKIDESDSFILCANKLGCVFIFTINKLNKSLWTFFKKIQDNQKEITSIDLNENLNIFITSDKEGFINIYTFPQCKLFNSHKLKENQLPIDNNPNDNNNNSSSVSRSESNINLSLTQNDIFTDLVIISHNPLPCMIFYIKSKKCLCVFSINFHFINAKYGIELVQNGIKKYSDYFRKDYLFIYNKNNKTIDIYDILNLQIISRSSKFDYTFVDFYFSKGMELALIMVKINEEENKNENIKDKNLKKNYKILMLNTQVKTDKKTD